MIFRLARPRIARLLRVYSLAVRRDAAVAGVAVGARPRSSRALLRRGARLAAAADAGDDVRMLVLFEIHLARGADPSQLLSAEVTRDAKAKILTREEARTIGFAGLPEPPEGRDVRYISAVGRDAKWIQHVLENSSLVASMRTYEVG